MINNKRPITAYERDILELVRTKFKEALEQRLKNKQHKGTMTRNEFIHRAIIAQMANPYAWGKDNNPFRMSFSDIIDAADDMADFAEQSGIHFDALPEGDGHVHTPLGNFRLRVDKEEPQDPRPDTKEERLEALKARREELHKELCDILDKNSVTNPSQLPKEEMLNYFDANCELRYIRDQIDAIYKNNP